jgi:hypothetical protein
VDGTFTGGAAASNSYDFGIKVATTKAATGVTTTLPLDVHAAPLPTSLDVCTSIAGTACANVNAKRSLTGTAALTGGLLSYSTGLQASSSTTASVAINATSCAGANTGVYSQMTGTYENKALSVDSSQLSGFIWEDSNGASITDCSDIGGALLTAFPSGLKAGGGTPAGRLATWGKTLGFVNHDLAQTGAITCPTGSLITATVGSAVLDFTPYLCPSSPMVTFTFVATGGNGATFAVPKAFMVLTAVPIVSPPLPNQPTPSVQWQRCTNASPSMCNDIPGKTSFVYVVANADKTFTLRVKLTATNTYGTTIAYSQNSGVVS